MILNRATFAVGSIARTGGGGLEVTDTPKALTIRAVLPETRDADRYPEPGNFWRPTGLERRIQALQERRENQTRVLPEKALLGGIGVVDSVGLLPMPQFRSRARLDSVLRSVIPSGVNLQCRCHRGTQACNTVEFSPEVWDESLESGKEILAITSEFSSALASRSRGGLTLRRTAEGLAVELRPATTDAARELLEQAAEVSLLMRPVFNEAVFEERLVDGVLTAFYSSANLRAVLLGPTDASEGWPVVLIDRPTEGRQEERRRLWL